MKIFLACMTSLALLMPFSSLSGAPTLPQAAARQTQRHLQIVGHVDRSTTQRRPRDRDLSAYLMVYFKDETHSLHFAVSADGYSFTDVNDGAPVLRGGDIAQQKGIRDPHIVRGPDGAFYLSMTDLHIFATREGLRQTEWERPAKLYGWGNNRSIILMKSYDLIHWTHSIVHVDELFPETTNIGAAWAPQTIYDPAKKKMMVYFTTRDGNGLERMVYSYADNAFTTITTTPQPLFAYPKKGIGTIDGDITRIGSKYHLFYVAFDAPGSLRQATSAKINSGYAFNPARVDPEPVRSEAPSLWRRHGTNTYVLMYDVFGAKPNNMGFSETRDFVHFKDIGHFNDPGSPMKSTNFSQPKHGAVMPITLDEAKRLRDYFSQK
jgi:hypothetical protein